MNNLNSLNGWAEKRAFSAPHSAQGYQYGNVNFNASSCGSSCGSGDPNPQPSSCGSGDADPKPSSCGSSCGAGEK